jgi:hypothetical protein
LDGIAACGARLDGIAAWRRGRLYGIAACRG